MPAARRRGARERLPHRRQPRRRQRQYPWQLSGGMQQRVAIARAIAYEPQVLLMDEPFAAVDAQTRFKLEDLVRSLWKRLGVTVVFVTHDIDESIYLAERVLVLSGRPPSSSRMSPSTSAPSAINSRRGPTPSSRACAPTSTSSFRRPNAGHARSRKRTSPIEHHRTTPTVQRSRR